MTEDLEPEGPEEAGLDEKTPDRSRVEGAHLLASQARDRLAREGFAEDQILDWAETYIAEEGSGDVDAFIDWIAKRESGG